MKRYWKLFIFLFVIVIAIGTFYIKAALATSNYPVYAIEKQSGDEKEIESMILFGSFYFGDYYDDYQSEEVQLTLEDMAYFGEQSIFKRLTGSGLDPQIKSLQKKYWSFTRGKITDKVNYFSNDDYLAYSNMANERSFTNGINQYGFQIAVLDKQTNKTISFDMKVPNAEAFAYVSTASVQMVGDELKVITRNAIGAYDDVEFYLYTFDIAHKKLKSGEMLLKKAKSNANNTTLHLLEEREIERSGANALFYEVTTKDIPAPAEDNESEDGEKYIEEEVENLKLHIYNLEAGELTTEELPKELYNGDYSPLYDGESIYFTKWGEQNSEINTYNIDSKKLKI